MMQATVNNKDNHEFGKRYRNGREQIASELQLSNKLHNYNMKSYVRICKGGGYDRHGRHYRVARKSRTQLPLSKRDRAKREFFNVPPGPPAAPHANNRPKQPQTPLELTDEPRKPRGNIATYRITDDTDPDSPYIARINKFTSGT